MSRFRSALAAGALLLPLGGAVIATAPAAAAAEGCSAAEVTVLVDFASLGGGVQTGCTGGDPASGVEALQAAGFPPTRAAAERSGYFVCRIAGKPADDPCQRASPAGAVWSYWHAQPGGAWTYAGQGAGSSDPAPGSVEGWSFGAGDPPSSPPPRTAAAVASAAPPAAPRQAAPTTPASASAPPAAPAATSAAEPVAPSASPGASSATPVVPTESPAQQTVPSPTPDSASTPVAVGQSDVAPSSGSADDTGGGPVAALAAGGLVLLLTGGALLQARRRRGDVTP